VTAQNQAGSASQTSTPSGIFKIGRARLNRRRGTARLPVTVPGPGALTLTGKGVVSQRLPRGARASPALARTISAPGTYKLLVKTKAKRKKKLNNTGRVKVNVSVTYMPTGGTSGSQTKKLKLK
jgi:hypothetical protein